MRVFVAISPFNLAFELVGGTNLLYDFFDCNAVQPSSTFVCVVAAPGTIQAQETGKALCSEFALEDRECMALKLLIRHFPNLHLEPPLKRIRVQHSNRQYRLQTIGSPNETIICSQK